MSKVFFTNLRTKPGHSLLEKFDHLLRAAGIEQLACKDKFTAIKLHFGEPGNMAFLRHQYAAALVGILKELGAKPFLTDCNTLYSGRRANAIDHLMSASENGFNALSVPGAPVIIADGLRGVDEVEMPIPGGRCFKSASIGAAIAQADVIVSLTHFKGHEQTSFGGALKNLGMGSASVGGKLKLHSNNIPYIDVNLCRGCNNCVIHCRQKAIRLNDLYKAEIDSSKCVGCGQCIAMCMFGAAVGDNSASTRELTARISEYSLAVVHGKPAFHISLIMNVSPNCDCWGSNDVAIVPDLGMLASTDPVALDQACVDLVQAAPAIPGTALTDKEEDLCCDHKFTAIHPTTDGVYGLEYAESIGLGERAYTLVRV